jgi:hypothetical protein
METSVELERAAFKYILGRLFTLQTASRMSVPAARSPWFPPIHDHSRPPLHVSGEWSLSWTVAWSLYPLFSVAGRF